LGEITPALSAAIIAINKTMRGRPEADFRKGLTLIVSQQVATKPLFKNTQLHQIQNPIDITQPQ